MLPIALETLQWGLGGLGGVFYIVLMVALGFTALRKGHWIMFILGLGLPLFRLIGAVIPPVDKT